jgi:hypothetical protein
MSGTREKQIGALIAFFDGYPDGGVFTEHDINAMLAMRRLPTIKDANEAQALIETIMEIEDDGRIIN